MEFNLLQKHFYRSGHRLSPASCWAPFYLFLRGQSLLLVSAATTLTPGKLQGDLGREQEAIGSISALFGLRFFCWLPKRRVGRKKFSIFVLNVWMGVGMVWLKKMGVVRYVCLWGSISDRLLQWIETIQMKVTKEVFHLHSFTRHYLTSWHAMVLLTIMKECDLPCKEGSNLNFTFTTSLPVVVWRLDA